MRLFSATDSHGLSRTQLKMATDLHGLKRANRLSGLSVLFRVSPWPLTIACALLHFLVDGLCVCCLYLLLSAYGGVALVGGFILYNVLAFLTQPLTGMLADSRRLLPMLLPLSVVFLAVAVVLVSLSLASHTSHFSPLTSLIIAFPLGLGNSLFHVWGGKTVATATGNDPRALGVFVSTGAFGLAVGMLLHTWWVLYLFLVLIALLTVTMPMAPVASIKTTAMRKPWIMWGAVLLLMGFVMFRSFLGEILTVGVAKGGAMALLIGGVAMAGKAAGGWLARGAGLFVTFLLCIAGAMSCLLMKAIAPWLWLPGLLFINGTMAVTLCWANRAMPGREGLDFGLLAAALMPGYMLAMAGATDVLFVMPSLILTLVSTVIIELGVLWMLRERRADVLTSSMAVNILTNIPLNIFIIYVSGSWTAFVIGEVLVLIVETLWYRYFVGEWRRAFIYSFLCNAISFLIGALVQLFFMLSDRIL